MRVIMFMTLLLLAGCKTDQKPNDVCPEVTQLNSSLPCQKICGTGGCVTIEAQPKNVFHYGKGTEEVHDTTR